VGRAAKLLPRAISTAGTILQFEPKMSPESFQQGYFGLCRGGLTF